ncbi:DUF2000 domain-containing protein [Serratia sp. L9]|uniref:DUF2000 domain-containing protein n=1 Tax=Serratia sp. L9 TaxID=3423946 RepID=UPI003D67FC53
MSEKMRLAIIVNPELPLGLLANTVSAIAIGMAAKFPMLAGTALSDTNGNRIDVSSKYPVPILQGDAIQIKALMLKALQSAGERAVVPFPAFARSLHAFEQYEQAFPERDLTEELIDGVGLVGPDKWVKSLTGNLKLLR